MNFRLMEYPGLMRRCFPAQDPGAFRNCSTRSRAEFQPCAESVQNFVQAGIVQKGGVEIPSSYPDGRKTTFYTGSTMSAHRSLQRRHHKETLFGPPDRLECEAGMEIQQERSGITLILILNGRFDQSGALQLQASAGASIREDDSVLLIDMQGVTYLSSGGIRSLVSLDRMLKSRGGGIRLCCTGEYPGKVLAMAGFDRVFPMHGSRGEALRAYQGPQQKRSPDARAVELPGGYRARIIPGSDDSPATLTVTGDMSRVLYSRLTEGEIVPQAFTKDSCIIGYGGLGENAADVFPLLGEVMACGGSIYWMQKDGSSLPDFLVPREGGEAPLAVACAAGFAGPFHEEIEIDTAITLDALYAALLRRAQGLRPDISGIVGIAFIADVQAVYSSRLRKSPIAPHAPANRECILHPANRMDWLSENADAAHCGETILGCGIGAAGDLNDALSALFPRELPATASGLSLLNFGAIFRHIAGEENVRVPEELHRVAAGGECIDLCRLREATAIRRAKVLVWYFSGVRTDDPLKITIEGGCPGWNPGYEAIVRRFHRDCSEVILVPLAGGYSGSAVFRVSAVDRNGRRQMPFVLKLGLWPGIDAEIRGYTDHVHRYIQNHATQIIQQGRSGEYGGILYNFVGTTGHDAPIISFEEYYRTHSAEEVVAVLDRLFRVVLRPWYGQPRQKDLALYRENSWFFGYEAVCDYALRRFGACREDRYVDLPFGYGRSANPIAFVHTIYPERMDEMFSVYEASVHGDLNMRNILLDGDTNIWLIDFSETRHSHIVRDIAKLEAVLKFEMVPIRSDEALETLIGLEQSFLGIPELSVIPEIPDSVTDPEMIRAFSCIRNLREFANILTLLDDNPAQYFLALFAYTLPAVGYESLDDRQKAYAWASASMLADRLM